MHGDLALQLVTASHRSTLATTPQLPLPKYALPLILSICLECRQLGSSIQSMAADELSLTQDRGLVCALTVQHLAARRNKRCLLAYLHNRVGGIKERWWDAGGGLAYLLSPAASASGSGTGSGQGGGAAGHERSGAGGTTNNSAAESLEGEAPDLRSALSPQELDFLRGYNALMLDYKSDFLDVLDLTAGIDRPPGELMVDVRVVRDAGEVILEGGERVEFKRGERFRLVRGQVERLIVQGYLEEI